MGLSASAELLVLYYWSIALSTMFWSRLHHNWISLYFSSSTQWMSVS